MPLDNWSTGFHFDAVLDCERQEMEKKADGEMERKAIKIMTLTSGSGFIAILKAILAPILERSVESLD
jgi:hypothetical protein